MNRSIALGVAILVSSVACRGRFAGSPSRTTPVVLISIDTLRSDHLPAYGYGGVETPNIDALRADSILYRRAYSHVPLTLPSHASILTGMLPNDNGVHDNVGFRLSESIPTLPALLKRNGYATGAAVSAFVLRRETGIARGFDFFDDEVEPIGAADQSAIGRVQRNGRETAQALEKWLDANRGKPFFALLHLYEPHSPYTPPEPYLSRYRNRYDGEIAYADAIVGEFLAHLKQHDLYDKTLIILLSDHGEGLDDHGEDEHGIFLYREALQVPLILKLPDGAKRGTTVDAPVQLIDILPTIAERTATALPADKRRAGESLLAVAKRAPQRQIFAETFYPKFHFGWSDLHSLIAGNDHYIRAPQPELYDLAADPQEKHNALEQNRRAYVRLRQAMEPFLRDAPAPSSIDSEDAAKLAALGYVGSTVSTPAGKALPDPKTTIGTFQKIRLAFTWYRNGKEDEALRLTEQLLAENSQITDLWDLKYKILVKMDRQRDAIDAAQQGLRSVPAAVSLLHDVATGALQIGDLDTAEQHAQLAVKLEPGRAHDILSRIWLRRGNVDRAVAEAKLSLETSPDPTGALIQLAIAEKERGNLQAALASIDRAVEKARRKPSPPQDLHLARGDILARLGRNTEAEEEFRAEIAHYPSALNAYSSLILLLAATGRTGEATQLVYKLVEACPGPRAYVVVSETLKAIGDDQGAVYWAYQGLRQYPKDPELRGLPKRLSKAPRSG